MATKVLILSDNARQEAALTDLVRAAGGWIVATGRPDAEIDGAGCELIVADLCGFRAFERFASLQMPMVFEIDAEAIDAAVARLPGAQLLVDPDPLERAATIAVALAGGGIAAVHEEGMPQLRQLSEEAGRIARALADLASVGALVAHPPSPAAPPIPAITAAFVRATIRKRRLRDRFFAAEIFAEPAWDILLDLYAARLEEKQVAVSSLCIAAHVPPTTALRWIRALTDQALLIRVADPDDGRRMFVALSEGAAGRMAAYFAAAES